MKDRQPQNAGRVRLVPVAGQANIYDMTMADGALEQGTPLNKATFLKDATAALFGLLNTAVPDDVLAVLGNYLINDAVKIETGSYVGTGTYGFSNPNSISFSFKPKLVIFPGRDDFSLVYGGNYSAAFPAIIKFEETTVAYFLNTDASIISYNGNTMSWYSDWGATAQRNNVGTIYTYIAIG